VKIEKFVRARSHRRGRDEGEIERGGGRITLGRGGRLRILQVVIVLVARA